MVSFLNTLSKRASFLPDGMKNADEKDTRISNDNNTIPRNSISSSRNSISAGTTRMGSSQFTNSSSTSSSAFKSNVSEHTNLTSVPSLSQTPLVRRDSASPALAAKTQTTSDVKLKDTIKDPNLLREIENLRTSYRQQNFWKYHIIKLAPYEFYITTNPDKRHRFVRNAPSYFVKLELPQDPNAAKDENKRTSFASTFRSQNQVDKGFRLIFTQQQVMGINGYDGTYKSFVIEKCPKAMGGHYKISCQYNEFQQDWNIHNNINDKNKNNQRNLNFQFSNQNAKPSKDTTQQTNTTKSHEKDEMYDAANNLVLADDYTMGDFLHVCSIKDKKKTMFMKNKLDGVKLAKENSVYFLDTGFFKKRKWFDPVVSLFRPCNRDMKNKLTKSVLLNSKLNIRSMNKVSSSKKLFSANKLNVDFSSMSMKNGSKSIGKSDTHAEDNNEDDDDDYDYGDEDDEDEEMSENIVDLANTSAANYSKFYNAKDGFYNRHPKDDSPNDYKLGWITIYEKGRYFEKIPNGGNWQMVLGMTFAVGFEKLIDKYIHELSEMQ